MAARANRGDPEPIRELQRPKAYTTDPIDVLDTHGIRVGMTLAVAKVAAAKVGAEIPPANTTNGMFREGSGIAPNQFVRVTQGGPNYTGPRMDRYSNESVRLRVFPKNPQGDINADDNLIIYEVTAMERYPVGPVEVVFPYSKITQTEFLRRARERFPELHSADNTDKSPRQECANLASWAVGAVDRVAEIRAAGGTTTMAERMGGTDPQAKGCEDILVIAVNAMPDGVVNSVGVMRRSIRLAVQAADSLAQVVGYQHETKVWVEQEAKKKQYGM